MVMVQIVLQNFEMMMPILDLMVGNLYGVGRLWGIVEVPVDLGGHFLVIIRI